MLSKSFSQTVTGVSASATLISRQAQRQTALLALSARSFSSACLLNKFPFSASNNVFSRNNNHQSLRSIRSIPKSTNYIPNLRNYSAITLDTPAPIADFSKIKEISTASASDSSSPSSILVDVREPAEFAEGHIPGAVNLPFKTAPGALGLEPEEFFETFGFQKPSTETQLVFYCLAGVRSTAAESLAATFGYQS